MTDSREGAPVPEGMSAAIEQKFDRNEYSTATVDERFQKYRRESHARLADIVTCHFYLGLEDGGEELQELLNAKVNQGPTYYIDSPTDITAFKHKYDLIDKGYSDKLVEKAFGRFRRVVERAKRGIYWQFTLHEVAGLVTKELPELKGLIEKLEDSVSFLDNGSQATNEDNFDELDYGGSPMGMGDVYTITVPKLDSYEQITRHQLLRDFIIAHEFFHIVNFHFTKETFGPSTNSENMEGKHSVLYILMEASSISFEHALLKRLDSQADNSQLEPVKKFGKWRIDFIFKAAKFKHEKPRTQITEHGSGDYESSYWTEKNVAYVQDVPQLNYSEGAKLAIDLQRNGWTIHDLPELWNTTKEILDELIKDKKIVPGFDSSPPFDIYTENAGYQKFSTWENLRKRLREVKPKRLVEKSDASEEKPLAGV